VILHTDRLTLREFAAEDWRAVWEYESHPQHLRFYPWAKRRQEDVQDLVSQFVAWQAQSPRARYQLAVTLKSDGCLIGTCGVRRQRADAHEADLGYEIAYDHWGRGYATEAARAMLDFGFQELRIHRIWAHCVSENLASVRVLEGLGFRHEGTLREHRWMKGRWWDTNLYGLLAREWFWAAAGDRQSNIGDP
jgi:RimJ/RimL family protein N-acetyltransferase